MAVNINEGGKYFTLYIGWKYKLFRIWIQGFSVAIQYRKVGKE